MNKLEENIFERTYQSYLCGADTYTYKFETNNPKMVERYIKAVDNLEVKELVIVKNKLENKVKLSISEKGIEFGNSKLI